VPLCRKFEKWTRGREVRTFSLVPFADARRCFFLSLTTELQRAGTPAMRKPRNLDPQPGSLIRSHLPHVLPSCGKMLLIGSSEWGSNRNARPSFSSKPAKLPSQHPAAAWNYFNRVPQTPFHFFPSSPIPHDGNAPSGLPPVVFGGHHFQRRCDNCHQHPGFGIGISRPCSFLFRKCLSIRCTQ
jgi:hypothetical protein